MDDLIYLQLKLLMLSGDVNRKAATVMTETELVAKGGSRTGSPGIIKVRLEQNMPLTSDTNEAGIQELNYTTNWRLRYSSFIIAAEAYNKATQI
jgi:hypothetical protein